LFLFVCFFLGLFLGCFVLFVTIQVISLPSVFGHHIEQMVRESL